MTRMRSDTNTTSRPPHFGNEKRSALQRMNSTRATVHTKSTKKAAPSINLSRYALKKSVG
jgi:hypothetical protein